MTKLKRHKRLARIAAAKLLGQQRHICSRCGEPGYHFVPPSLGEPGFPICDQLPEGYPQGR